MGEIASLCPICALTVLAAHLGIVLAQLGSAILIIRAAMSSMKRMSKEKFSLDPRPKGLLSRDPAHFSVRVNVSPRLEHFLRVVMSMRLDFVGRDHPN